MGGERQGAGLRASLQRMSLVSVALLASSDAKKVWLLMGVRRAHVSVVMAGTPMVCRLAFGQKGLPALRRSWAAELYGHHTPLALRKCGRRCCLAGRGEPVPGRVAHGE